MSAIILSPNTKALAWTYFTLLFCPTVLLLWRFLRSGKKVSHVKISTRSIIAIAGTIFATIYYNLFNTTSTERYVYTSVFFLMTECEFSDYKSYLLNLVYESCRMLWMIDSVHWVTQYSYDKLNDMPKYIVQCSLCFIMVPLACVAAHINNMVLDHLRKVQNNMDGKLHFQNSEEETQEIITFPIDEPFNDLIVKEGTS